MVKSMQAHLEKFLYEGQSVQCNDEKEVVPITVGSVVGLNASPSHKVIFVAPYLAPTQSSNSDCVLLDVGSTPAKEPILDLKVLDPVLALLYHEKVWKKRRNYEANRHFQDSWAAKLPWAKSMIGANGEVS